jgi:NADH-quinone oxidoreductase subunit C
LTPAETSAALAARFAGSIVEQSSFRDEYTSVVKKDILVESLRLLRDDLSFNHLSDVTAVDWIGRHPRFDVVYQLFSFEKCVWYRLKVRVDDNEPVPTVVGLWPCANWAEREVWDLFGIVFDGHPALHRIMLPEGWVGHPLRKDYPMSQITLPRSGATKMPE